MLIWSIVQRTRLDKQKYAIDMIKEWNSNTSSDTSLIRSHFPGNYDKCEPISMVEVRKIIDISLCANLEEKQKYTDIKNAIYRLFNYFEYVSAAYNRGTVDKKKIKDSFSLTMLRYFTVLRNFFMLEFLTSKRNHWTPYTKHLEDLTMKKRSKIKCSDCDNEYCLVGEKGHKIEKKLLYYLNSDKFSRKLFTDFENEFYSTLK
jgi:hypothetical protein